MLCALFVAQLSEGDLLLEIPMWVCRTTIFVTCPALRAFAPITNPALRGFGIAIIDGLSTIVPTNVGVPLFFAVLTYMKAKFRFRFRPAHQANVLEAGETQTFVVYTKPLEIS